MPYNALAPCYDAFTRDVDYRAWADLCEKIFAAEGKHPRLVLDLACGTGSLSCELAGRGYEVIGADASEDMLSQAAEKAARLEGCAAPLFICQTMQELDLYGTVEAAVCSLDGLNYLPPEELDKALSRLHLFLEPGGIFVFDVNSERKLRGLDGQVFVDETEDSLCLWRAEFDAPERRCRYGMDIFTRRGKLWRRDFEEHIEYAYSVSELEERLAGAGFASVKVYGGPELAPASGDEQRLYFSAVRP